MAELRTPLPVIYDPLYEEMWSTLYYEFEESINPSWNETIAMPCLGNRTTNVFSSLEAVSTKDLCSLHPSNLGEYAFEAPDDAFFENIDQFLINDEQIRKEVDASVALPKLDKKDTPSISTNKTFTKPTSKYTDRVDVVNKGILRMIKSFYQDLLFDYFPDYKTKRLCRVNKSKLFGDINGMIKKFTNINLKDNILGEQVFCALRPNDVSFITPDVNFQKEVKAYFDCISKYSHKRLREVFKTTFGKTIFKLIAEKEGAFEMLLNSNPIVKKNKSAYVEGVKRFSKGFGLDWPEDKHIN